MNHLLGELRRCSEDVRRRAASGSPAGCAVYAGIQRVTDAAASIPAQPSTAAVTDALLAVSDVRTRLWQFQQELGRPLDLVAALNSVEEALLAVHRAAETRELEQWGSQEADAARRARRLTDVLFAPPAPRARSPLPRLALGGPTPR